MKTLNQVLRQTEYKTLVRSVLRNVGMDSIQDINSHGIDSGFSGFIYYSDTVNFYNRHKKDILKMAAEMARDLGEDMISMIQHFNCLSSGHYSDRKPDYTQTEIAEALYSGRGECATQIKNAMAWFAAETVCRMFED